MDAVIQFEGTIYEQGYGLIAQQVMRDKTLPKQAKLIYSYMCSFAGTSKNGERTAFPSISLQCHELDMNENTYYKWRKYLIERGLIKITKQRQKGAKFDRNVYSILAVPKPTSSDKVDSYNLKTISEQENEPYLKKQGMEDRPYPKKSCMDKPCTGKEGTNINSFTSNNFKRRTETKDTKETKIDKLFNISSEPEEEKRKDQMLKESLRNSPGVSERLFEILYRFSNSYEQMEHWIGIIFRAKATVEKDIGKLLLIEIEENDRLICTGVMNVMRNLRNPEIINPDNYMFTALTNYLKDSIIKNGSEPR